MHENFILYKDIMKQTFFIASSRLLTLFIPVICLSLLSNSNITSVGDFSVSNQYIQILIVIMISLNIGTNIILYKNKENIKLFLEFSMWIFLFHCLYL